MRLIIQAKYKKKTKEKQQNIITKHNEWETKQNRKREKSKRKKKYKQKIMRKSDECYKKKNFEKIK